MLKDVSSTGWVTEETLLSERRGVVCSEVEIPTDAKFAELFDLIGSDWEQWPDGVQDGQSSLVAVTALRDKRKASRNDESPLDDCEL